jgi:hypothetical protein
LSTMLVTISTVTHEIVLGGLNALIRVLPPVPPFQIGLHVCLVRRQTFLKSWIALVGNHPSDDDVSVVGLGYSFATAVSRSLARLWRKHL